MPENDPKTIAEQLLNGGANDWRRVELDEKALVLADAYLDADEQWANQRRKKLRAQQERDTARAKIKKLQRLAAFLASVIQSGETWSEACEAEDSAALNGEE